MKFIHNLLVFLMLGGFFIATLLGIVDAYAIHRDLERVSHKTEKAMILTLGCMTIGSLILSYI